LPSTLARWPLLTLSFGALTPGSSSSPAASSRPSSSDPIHTSFCEPLHFFLVKLSVTIQLFLTTIFVASRAMLLKNVTSFCRYPSLFSFPSLSLARPARILSPLKANSDESYIPNKQNGLDKLRGRHVQREQLQAHAEEEVAGSQAGFGDLRKSNHDASNRHNKATRQFSSKLASAQDIVRR